MKSRRFLWQMLLTCVCPLFFLACNAGNREGHKPQRIKSVLILGNSIVAHGAAPQIGWDGATRGMAASVTDSDFVHLLIAEIRRRDTSVTFDYANLVGFEWELDNFDFGRLDSFKAPDMMILRFSENVNDSSVSEGKFFRNYDKLIRHIDPDDEAVKVIVSGFWHRPKTNRMLQQYAKEHHYVFVKNDDLLADSSNSAYGLFKEPGVAAHPSDKGMRSIKERIWEQIRQYFPQ